VPRSTAGWCRWSCSDPASHLTAFLLRWPLHSLWTIGLPDADELPESSRHMPLKRLQLNDGQATSAMASGLRLGVSPRIRAEAFSAIMIVAAFVFVEVIEGMIEASATRSPSIP
jgi:hypothetical protein